MESYYLILISVLIMLHTILIFLGLRILSRLEASRSQVLEDQDRGTINNATGVHARGNIFAGRIDVNMNQSLVVGLHNNPNLTNMPSLQHTRPFPYIEVEPDFEGRCQSLKDLEEETKNVPSRYLSRRGFIYWITGIEGIGKSRLVHRFIENLVSRNDGREFLWFDCKDQQTLFEQFNEAARAHGFTLGSINLEDIEQMYDKFSKNFKLIVFDNVKSFGDIEEYLPKSTFGKFTVLATCGYLDPELRRPRGMSLTALNRAESKKLLLAVNSSNIIRSSKLNEEAFKTAIKFSNGIPTILKDMVNFAGSSAEAQHFRGNDNYNVQAFFNTWARQKYILKNDGIAQAEAGPISITDRFTEIMKDLLATIETTRAVTPEVQRAVVQILLLMSFLLPLPNRIPTVLLLNFLELDLEIFIKAIKLLRDHFILIELEKFLYLQIDGPVQSSLARVLWEDKRDNFDNFLESFFPRMQFCIDQVKNNDEIGQLSIRNCINALKERREKLNMEPERDLVHCLVEKVRFISGKEHSIRQ